MSYRNRIIALTVASIAGYLAPRLQGSVGVTGQEVSGATYRVAISGAASTVRCQVEAALSGPLVSDLEYHESPTLGEVVINTQRNGKPATTLTAFIYCPGFGISTVEATALDGAGARLKSRSRTSLATLWLPGFPAAKAHLISSPCAIRSHSAISTGLRPPMGFVSRPAIQSNLDS
jgi:hypothetical protein